MMDVTILAKPDSDEGTTVEYLPPINRSTAVRQFCKDGAFVYQKGLDTPR